MSLETELQNGLNVLKQRDISTISVEVKSVNKNNGTCIVIDDELEYEVRLLSIIKNDLDGFYLFPKVGSSVLIAPIEEDINRFHIVAYSEVENLKYSTNEVELNIDKNGFLLKKENETLKKLMSDLIKAIKAMKFTTNSGPTIKLINIADFIALEKRFNNLLKDN